MDWNKHLCKVEVRQPPDDDNSEDGRMYLTAIISSGEVDAHGTRMTEKTLKNFASDLKSDIQFKDSHQYGHGFGVSTGGSYRDNMVYGDFTLMPGYNLRNASYPNSDEFIRAISDGIIKDVSVGFSGGTRICSICEARWYSDNCYHYPGRTYEKIDKKTGKKAMVRAEVYIDDAHLVEVSAVSRGSNPDSEIISKAQRCLEAGQLPEDLQRELEEMYEIRLDPSINPQSKKREVKPMDLEKMQEELISTRASLTELQAKYDELQAKVPELEALANCGREARKQILGEVIEAYKVRQGETVTTEQVDKTNERCSRLTYVELIGERDFLVSQAPEAPKVSTGSKTSQPDASSKRDMPKDDGEAKTPLPPTWRYRYAAKHKRL